MHTEIEIEKERHEAWDTEKETEKEAEFSFPTTVRSLPRFRPPDFRNKHRQRYIFFLNFVGMGIKFRFDSFLLWLFGLSIKMFVFSILDICFCFVFLDYRYH